MLLFSSQAESSVKLRSRAIQGAQQRSHSFTFGSECGKELGYSCPNAARPDIRQAKIS